MIKLLSSFALLTPLLLIAACSSDGDSGGTGGGTATGGAGGAGSGGAGECTPGGEGCACLTGDTCDAGLTCVADVCESEGGEGTVLFDGAGTWIDGTGNDVGIQGAFFVLEDSMKDGEPVDDGLTHSDLDPSEFEPTTEKPCVSGTIAPVTADDGSACDPAVDGSCAWGAIWGGGIGLNLNETGGDDSVKSPYDATAAGVKGFSFTTSGDSGGATVRFKAKMEGSDADFCAEVTGDGGSFELSELVHNCYAGGVASETLDLSKLIQLEWQLVSSAGTEYTIEDYCIEEVSYF